MFAQKPDRLKCAVPFGVNAIVEDATLRGTPARCNVATKIIRISPEIYKLPQETQCFIINHEAAHIAGNLDEFSADQGASERYFTGGGSPKQSVKALTRVLNMKNPEHRARAIAQLYRAAEQDYKTTGNPNAKKILQMFNQFELPADHLDYYEQNYTGNEDWEHDFLGLGKKAAARREEKRDLKTQNKLSKINKRDTNAATKLELAKQGIASGLGPGVSKFLESAGGLAEKFLGGGSPAVSPEVAAPSDAGAKGKDDKKPGDEDKILGMSPGLFWGLLVGVIVLIIIAIIFLKKKK